MSSSASTEIEPTIPPRRISPWLWISLVLCLISVLGASAIQTSWYSVKLEKVDWTTNDGRQLSGYLLTPKDISEDEKRPAIVTTHGWFNNKEMQDMNYTEFARRGYVVLALDMFSHGNSEPIKETDIRQHGTGMYDAVQYISQLPRVDTTKIGITGHSNGARASNWAVDDDNASAEQLIHSVYLVGNDAQYQDTDGNYVNKYRSRNVGVVAGQYDEFFFRMRDEKNKPTSAPRDFIDQPTAQSFLHFGQDPAGLEPRVAGEYYTQSVDGKEAIRVVQTPNEIHPWNTMSAQTVTGALEFFDRSLGSPKQIAADNHVFWWKFLFNALGLVGIAIFLYQAVMALLRIPFFAELRASTEIKPFPRPTGGAKAWFWISLVLVQLFAIISYIVMFPLSLGMPEPFRQWPNFYIGIWAVSVALFVTLLLVIGWYAFGGRKSGISLADRGVAIGWQKFGKSVLLAMIVIAMIYLMVFGADAIANSDFRFWIVPIKAFRAFLIPQILLFLPFFLSFYVVNSIAINSFNYVGNEHEADWPNTLLLAVFNVLNVVVMLAVQYGTFYATGYTWIEKYTPLSNIMSIWLFPLVVYFPATAVYTRMIFKKTGNPWLGGLIFGSLVTIMAVTNTITQLPS